MRIAQRVMVLLLTPFVALVGGLSIAGVAQADTEYYFQGTGDTATAPEYIKKHASDSGYELVDMSTNRGWKADFAPVQGKSTADQSVMSGVALANPSILQDLTDGKRVALTGYSLGSLVAGDLGADLAKAGVDISNMKFTLISDGHTANTGALVVLERIEPVADIMSMIGITPGPREVPSTGQWEFVCIAGDGVCDVPDVLRDPVGALDSLVGYFVKHGGADPQYNYGNGENLESTTYVNGNVTTVVYHAPRAITRAVELVTGSVKLSERVDAILEKLITSSGDPGQEKTYKSLPETIRDVVSIFDPQAPLLPATPEEVPAFAGEVAGELVEEVTPKLGGFVGGAIATQLAGPAATLIGEQVGTYVGEQVAPVLAPIVEMGVETAVEYALTGNTNTEPLEEVLNNAIPAGLPKIDLPPVPALAGH